MVGVSLKVFGLIFILISFFACTEEIVQKKVIEPVPGEIQVLNACGIPRAAEKMREFLVSRGFDVVEVGNAPDWNFRETIISLRNRYWQAAPRLAKELTTTNLILLENPIKMVDATVYVGRDFEEKIANESKE